MAIVEAAKKIQDGTDTQKEAITMYDADVVKRGGDEVTQAVQNSKFITDYKMVQQSTVMHKGLDRVN